MLHVAIVQYDIAWEAKPTNHAEIERLLDGASIPAGALVLLPELGDTGFSFALDRIVDDATLPWAREVARRRGIFLQVGYAERGPEGLGRNCAAIVAPDGAVRGVYRKVHPFSFGRESEHYAGGAELLLADLDEGGQGAKVAPAICYDLRFPELFRHAALAGAEVLALGANWPETRQAHWRALLIARAIENQAFALGANRTGRDPHLGYCGGSIIVDPMGRVLAEAEAETAVLQATLDLDGLRAWRATFPALRDIRRGLLGTIPVVPGTG